MKVNPFGKVPDDLKGKSIKEISDLLSTHGIESPEHFHLVHELNRRIAQPQIRAIYIGIVAALLGIVLGWALSQWMPSEPKASLNIIFNYLKKKDQGDTGNKGNDDTGNKILPSSSSESNPIKPIDKSDSQIENYQNKQQGNNTKPK
jgi:hypothetical protein